MTSTLEQIARAALRLTPVQRAELAELLVSSLAGGPPDALQKSWGREASRRLTEIREGLAAAVPAEDVLAEARALLKS